MKGTVEYSTAQARELNPLNTVWCVSLEVSKYRIYLHIEIMLCLQKKDFVLPYVSAVLCRQTCFIWVRHMAASWFARKSYNLWDTGKYSVGCKEEYSS